MTKEPEKPSEKREKKIYKKPTIRSARFFERRALACPKTEFGGGNPDCSPAFTS